MLNPYQQIACVSYGEFHQEREIERMFDEHRAGKVSLGHALGDTLLAYLLIDLSDEEDCDTIDVAIDRLDRAIADIERVRNALEHVRADVSVLQVFFPNKSAIEITAIADLIQREDEEPLE